MDSLWIFGDHNIHNDTIGIEFFPKTEKIGLPSKRCLE